MIISAVLATMGTVGALFARELFAQARVGFLQRRIIRAQMDAVDAEKRRSEALLLNVLPAKIADRLKASAGIIADAFPSVTVLFGDIVGFTEMSARLAPAELVRRLDEIFSRFDALVAQRGLEKIKTIGDAYMVIGGIPTPREDHAEAVCELALAIPWRKWAAWRFASACIPGRWSPESSAGRSSSTTPGATR